jgi:hypothetical protein
MKIFFMKKEIKMQFGIKVLAFQVTYECDTYIFAECNENPAARGFFTSNFITQNLIK